MSALYVGIVTDASSNVKNSSPELPAGIFCSKLKLEMQTVGLLVSILVPYYIVHSARIGGGGLDQREVGRASQAPSVCTFDGDTCFILPANVDASAITAEESMRGLRQELRFDFSSDEQPSAVRLDQSFEAMFGTRVCRRRSVK